MRIIFMGTPDFAVPGLRALAEAKHEILAVYTQPPRPGGRRGKELTPTPIHKAATELGIEVRHPVSLKDEQVQADFAALEADAAVVAAYGLILPQAVLDMPRLGCFNIHASLLPRWRGAAPVQRAILAGDESTGVTIMRMEAGLDTGPMLTSVSTLVDNKTAEALTDELAETGAKLMVDVLADLENFPAKAQDAASATYASKIDKAETRIDFTREAEAVVRQIRAFTPAAWFELDGERYRILSAEIVDQEGPTSTVLDNSLTIACNNGAIRPLRIQRAGKPAMDTADLLRGRPIEAGTLLNDAAQRDTVK